MEVRKLHGHPRRRNAEARRLLAELDAVFNGAIDGAADAGSQARLGMEKVCIYRRLEPLGDAALVVEVRRLLASLGGDATPALPAA